jgi:fatty-acyl-CoA synthase
MRPDRQLRARSVARRWGLTPAAAYSLAAIRYPDELAIIDDLGSATFAEVDSRTNALARALGSVGVGPDGTVAVSCRNHRGLIETTVACSKIGADVVYLDPDALPSVHADVSLRRPADVLVYDEDCPDQPRMSTSGALRLVAWHDRAAPGPDVTVDELIARARDTPLERAGRMSTVVVRCPPAAGMSEKRLACSLIAPALARARLPMRGRERVLIAAPLTGRWGFLHFMLALRYASTIVLMRRFDPLAVLERIDQVGAAVAAMTSEMLEEIVALPSASSACHDTASLRVISTPGIFLDSDVALPAIDRFGQVLYSLRGATVISVNRAFWSTAGRPVEERAALLA